MAAMMNSWVVAGHILFGP